MSGDFWGDVLMRLVAWACALSLLVVGCGGNDAAATCVELREPEDQASDRRPRRGHDRARQPTDSGPHIAGPTPGARRRRAAGNQVRVLESGGVMVQYDDAVVGAELGS